MNTKLASWIIFVLLCFIWGSSFILMKVANQYLTPYQVAALRIFSAAIVFIPFAVVHFRKVPWRKSGQLAVTGVLGNLLPAFCFAIALLKIDSSLTGILNALTPICVVVVGIVVFRDKIKTAKIVGVLIGFAGLCLLTISQDDISFENIAYTLLILLATLSYGTNVNFVTHFLKDTKPLHIASLSLAFMTLPSGLVLWQQNFFSVDFGDPRVQWAIVNCVLLGVVGSAIATVLFYLLVQKASGLFASLVTYGIPFVALFWGFLDGEAITVVECLCLAIILAGVYLANKPEKMKTGSR